MKDVQESIVAIGTRLLPQSGNAISIVALRSAGMNVNTFGRTLMEKIREMEYQTALRGWLDWTDRANVYVGEGPRATELKTLISMTERLLREDMPDLSR